MKDKIRKIKESISNAPHKKKAIIAILVALCLVGGAAGGYSYMTHTDFGKAEVSETELKDAEKAEDKAVSEEKKAEEELEKAKKSGDKEAIEKAEKKVEAAKEKVSSAKKEVASANKGSSHKTNASSNKNNSSTKKPSNSGNSSTNKPSSGNGGSSGSSSGGSSTSKPSKPSHQHSWKPEYGTREVPYQVDEGGYYVTVCVTCGVENPSYEHMRDHALKGENDAEKEVYKPNYVTKYRTEKYIKYYKCSCGATK